MRQVPGLAPQLRDALDQMGKAMNGDLVFQCSPATLNTPATANAWTRTVRVRLVSADGKIHDWFNKDIASGVSIADASSAGTASLASTTLSFRNGEALVVVSGNAAAWAAADTDTLTVAALTLMGYTVTAKTSVETFV